MDPSRPVPGSMKGAYDYFYEQARPTWQGHVAEARARHESSRDRRADGRRRQFSVGIADRPQLDALAETLGLARSEVINLALGELAESVGASSDAYARLYAEANQCVARYLTEVHDLSEAEALRLAGRFGRMHLPRRRTWLEVLKGSRSAEERRQHLRGRFEEVLGALYEGKWRLQIERWIHS